MAEGRTARALPTVTGFAAKQAIAALRKRGVAAAPLMRRTGLSERALARDPDAHPCPRSLRQRSSTSLQKRWKTAPSGCISPCKLIHAMQGYFSMSRQAQNLGEALSLFARYFRIVNEAVRLQLTRAPAGTAVEIEFVGLPRHEVRQNAEFGIAVILKALREITGRNIRPERVAFAHPRNANLREFERFYGCPVEFGRAANEGMSSDLLNFSNETLAIPLITADAKLLEALRPFAIWLPRNEAHRQGRYGLRSKMKWRSCCRTARERARGGESASAERPHALTKAGRRGYCLCRGGRSVAAKPRAPVPEGAGHVAFADRVAAWLRRVNVVQSRIQAVDGALAICCTQPEAASAACSDLIRVRRDAYGARRQKSGTRS